MHARHSDPAVDRKVRSSLKLSIADAASFSVMLGAAESYFQAFALFLKATVFQAGIVYSIPVFTGSLVQLFYRPLLHLLRSRKTLCALAGLLRTVLFVPLVLLYFAGAPRVWILLAVIALYFSMNLLPVPVWTSWMGDLVDPSRRGAYFSRRNGLANLIALTSIAGAGLLLELFSGRPFVGFAMIFGLAFLGSLGSTVSLFLKYEPQYSEPRRSAEPFPEFVARMHRTNYGRFVLFTVIFHFGIFLAGPFFVPYMLRQLSFSYLQFMAATALPVLVKFVTMRLWGDLGDRHGNRKILTVASLLIALTPFTWMVSRSFWWICAIQALAGLAWAGFDIAALNFAYDTMARERVTRYTSYLAFLRGTAILAGSVAGGWLMSHLRLEGSPYLAIFAVSALARLVLACPWLLVLKEERPVEPITYRRLMLRLVSIGPRRGTQMFPLGREELPQGGERRAQPPGPAGR